MAQKQKTPMMHCAATVMHSKPWNKMRNRTAAVSGRGEGKKVGLAHAEEQREKLVNSKKSAGAKGKYKRSSKTIVKGARKKGATLRDWFEKEDWRRVDDPSKKCGE